MGSPIHGRDLSENRPPQCCLDSILHPASIRISLRLAVQSPGSHPFPAPNKRIALPSACPLCPTQSPGTLGGLFHIVASAQRCGFFVLGPLSNPPGSRLFRPNLERLFLVMQKPTIGPWRKWKELFLLPNEPLSGRMYKRKSGQYLSRTSLPGSPDAPIAGFCIIDLSAKSNEDTRLRTGVRKGPTS